MMIKNSDSFLEAVAMAVRWDSKKHARYKLLNVARKLGKIFSHREAGTVAPPWQTACEQLVENDTHCINIALNRA
jgi:hypothetical protein